MKNRKDLLVVGLAASPKPVRAMVHRRRVRSDMGEIPWLTEEDYWRGQSKTFLEQVKVLQEPPLQLTPMY